MFYALRFGKILCIWLLDTPVSLHISLIACDYDDYVFVIGVFLQLADPLFNFLEWLCGYDLVDYDGTDCIPIVDGSHRIVLLLARSVPNC